MEIYRCEDYRIAIDNAADTIIVEKNNDFFKLDSLSFASIFDETNLVRVRTIEDSLLIALIMVTTIVTTLVFYFIRTQYVIFDESIVLAMLFLIVNIVLHEIGHVLFLKLFDTSSKVKIGFKFIFIYPAFYVDTTSSYLLPKFKRVAVYLAGSFMNCLFLVVIMVFFPSYLNICYLITTSILVNFLPIIKSDGYYSFAALLGRYGFEKGKLSSFLENFARGFIMFLLLGLLSYLP